jgi:hypothetical protein
MFRRIPQPPLNAALRDREQHALWPGLAVALLGMALMVCGARHLTGVETVDGAAAWETQLVKAYSSGGLQYPERTPPPPPPPKFDDPAGSAAALERWARQSAQAAPPPWKVRVDTAAKTPCPT